MSKRGNENLTAPIGVRFHPRLRAWLESKADREFTTIQEVLRRLIVEAMLAEDKEQHDRRQPE